MYRVWTLVSGKEVLCISTYSLAVALVYHLAYEYGRGQPTYIQGPVDADR